MGSRSAEGWSRRQIDWRHAASDMDKGMDKGKGKGKGWELPGAREQTSRGGLCGPDGGAVGTWRNTPLNK